MNRAARDASGPTMRATRKPFQLSFTTGPMLKRLEALRTCDVCRKSFMVGFECHTCGIPNYLDRRERAVQRNRCMTQGCARIVVTKDGCCGDEHQRAELLRLRDHFVSALHTTDALAPGYQSTFYAREVARIGRALGLRAFD